MPYDLAPGLMMNVWDGKACVGSGRATSLDEEVYALMERAMWLPEQQWVAHAGFTLRDDPEVAPVRQVRDRG